MARVWSEQHKLERWLDVELAALDAWAELGVIPEDVARSAREQAAAPTPERVRSWRSGRGTTSPPSWTPSAKGSTTKGVAGSTTG